MTHIHFEADPYIRGRETFRLRPAGAGDAAALAEIKRCVWPDEEADTAHMAHVLARPERLTLLAEYEGAPAGFLDCFLTRRPSGPCWEADLLAVRAEYRGRRLAEAMLNAGLQAAPAAYSRALIQTGNIASQTTFARCGYHTCAEIQRLYVSHDPYPGPMRPGPDASCLLVHTLSYSGIWLENSFTIQDLLAARAMINRDGAALAGAVIPASCRVHWQDAEQQGYQLVAEYQWWERSA